MKNMVRYGMATVLMLYSVNAFAQIRVTEIGYNGVMYEGAAKWVELQNLGDTEVDVSNLVLCDFPRYPLINELTPLGGTSATIPAGGLLVVAWPDLGGGLSHAEVGLYKEGTGFAFEVADNMLDYMQFGQAGHEREPVAVAAGLWTADEFVASAEAGKSLQLVISDTGEEQWEDRDPTPNAVNSTATAIEDLDDLPGDFRLFANFPNPFNPSTSISYELNRSGEVVLSVYDMLGKKVVDLHRGAQTAGSYSVSWDGRDASGIGVASGLYLYRLAVDGQNSQSRVMTLLK